MQKDTLRKKLKQLLRSREIVKAKLAEAYQAIEKSQCKPESQFDTLLKISSTIEIERQTFIIEIFEKRFQEIQTEIAQIIDKLEQ